MVAEDGTIQWLQSWNSLNHIYPNRDENGSNLKFHPHDHMKRLTFTIGAELSTWLVLNFSEIGRVRMRQSIELPVIIIGRFNLVFRTSAVTLRSASEIYMLENVNFKT
jgi:hypothetical protein